MNPSAERDTVPIATSAGSASMRRAGTASTLLVLAPRAPGAPLTPLPSSTCPEAAATGHNQAWPAVLTHRAPSGRAVACRSACTRSAAWPRTRSRLFLPAHRPLRPDHGGHHGKAATTCPAAQLMLARASLGSSARSDGCGTAVASNRGAATGVLPRGACSPASRERVSRLANGASRRVAGDGREPARLGTQVDPSRRRGGTAGALGLPSR